MTIRVTIAPRVPVITVKRNSDGTLTSSSPPQVSTSLAVNRLSTLIDVDTSDKDDGEALVYDEETNTFVIKKLTEDGFEGPVDGGSF